MLYLLGRLLRPLLARVELSGVENLPASGAYIISPNHQSYLDPFLMCYALPFRVFKNLFFVGAVEYFETPLTRWFARLANLVPVDPDSNLIPAMQAGAFGLAHGKILVLFPEGERSIDGTVKKFKKGAPILAQHLARADRAGGDQGRLRIVAARPRHQLERGVAVERPPHHDCDRQADDVRGGRRLQRHGVATARAGQRDMCAGPAHQ